MSESTIRQSMMEEVSSEINRMGFPTETDSGIGSLRITVPPDKTAVEAFRVWSYLLTSDLVGRYDIYFESEEDGVFIFSTI